MLWGSILAGVLILLGIGLFLFLPAWLDPQHFRQRIEKRISHDFGRPMALSGQVNLSLFPEAMLTLSDVRVGPPAGLGGPEFLTVKSVRARVEWLPLMFRSIRVKKLLVESPRLVLDRGLLERALEKGHVGRTAGPPPKGSGEKRRAVRRGPGKNLWQHVLALEEWVLTEGALIWRDEQKGSTREISDLSLQAHRRSANQSVSLILSGKLDGLPLSLEAEVGPVREEGGTETVLLAASVKALGDLEIRLKGQLATAPELDASVEASPFAPRRLLHALGVSIPDAIGPEGLERVSASMRLQVNRDHFVVSEGSAHLDETRLAFSGAVRDYAQPAVTFELSLDRLDLDRYLRFPKERGARREPRFQQKEPSSSEPSPEAEDAPRKQPALQGVIRAQEIQVHGTALREVDLNVSGQNGRYQLDPVTLSAYGGNLKGKGLVDLRGHVPEISAELHAAGIQAGPFLRDLFRREFLEGTLSGRADLRTKGLDAQGIQRSLQGEGDLRIAPGALVGVDLVTVARSIGLAGRGEKHKEERPRTRFSEFLCSFTLGDGVVGISRASMLSKGFKITAKGSADFVKETLDFRLEPHVGGRGEGRGHAEEEATLVVPILVTGTFSSPKVRPDLDGIHKEGKGRIHLEIPGPRTLRDLFKGPRKGE